jgi:glucan 1,3-beta-glucosidase
VSDEGQRPKPCTGTDLPAYTDTVRLPVPHWAFNGSTTEPYWALAEQPYISQALLWAKKYSLDVIIDMHTAPNSQNGYDNSGRSGSSEYGR